MKEKVKIALFASGSGTNVENIYKYFTNNDKVEVCCILCNKKNAYVLERAQMLKLDYLLFNRDDFYNSNTVLDYLKQKNTDLIVLAGFLWLIPDNLIKVFPDRIINIHPALLPKYGGKGMYGENVHKAVLENKEEETGITIHYVNQHYDEGQIIFQESVKIDSNDTIDSIANKVHKLEYMFFPTIIEKIALNL
ncbi:MAG: phosphoribosylglycinamide formyltransferase [Marinilabiliales bacterium]|nr:MAG: phosphoribosylglycinamide formyltransferase [Marinilabiliales bacterium]